MRNEERVGQVLLVAPDSYISLEPMGELHRHRKRKKQEVAAKPDSNDSDSEWTAQLKSKIQADSKERHCQSSAGRVKVEKGASFVTFVAIVCQHLFEGCNGCT